MSAYYNKRKKERGLYMNTKKLLCLLMALSLLLCLCGCHFPAITMNTPEGTQPATESTPAPTPSPTPGGESSITPLLYKVTDSEGHVLWLFGSIHVGYDYFYPLPDYVLEAYESADAIAFEVDMKAFEEDMDVQMKTLALMVYQDGTTIKDHIDPELYDAAVKILKEAGYYNQYLDYYMPILWSSFIDSCFVEEMGLDPDLGIDNHLLEKAYKDKKEVLEVESAEFQYQMMADFSPELQEILLGSSVGSYEDMEASKADMQKLVDLWASGDEVAFGAYLSEEGEFASEEEKKLYEEYNNAMVVDRNISMTDYAENALKSNKEIFICVGAAHIVGDGAMAQLLAQRGYTVERVTPTASI